MFGKTKHIHFIGIGGIGMSGMAELLYNNDFIITGSDISSSERVKHLKKIGIKIFKGHNKENISNYDLIVFSSAINENNVEIIKGKKLKIPIIKRSELLGELIKIKHTSIAVAGTHGKTTTSSMIATILNEAKLEPTLITGGIVNQFNSNYKSGSGDIIIVEADEYDKSFLSLSPTYITINNIELEHLDIYNDIEDIKDNFIQFSNSIPFYGIVSLCSDSKYLNQIKNQIKFHYKTFGIDKKSEVMAKNIKYKNNKTKFTVTTNNNKEFNIELLVPGKHNVYNALSAITLCLEINIPIKYIIHGLKKYLGVKRRFQIKHIIENRKIMIIDDYAHHPSEISATIKAAKSGWPNRRIIIIFQPHLFSRTKDFFKEFANALNYADINILVPIYGAREKSNKEVSSKLIIDYLKNINHKNSYLYSKNKLPEKVKKISKNGDIIITMGAGDIYKVIPQIYKEFNEQ